MGQMGRPRALDATKQREVCALVSAGYGLTAAAQYVGCTTKTIQRETERNAQFGEDLRKAQLVAQAEPLKALRAKARTHWRAAAWLLERNDPEQFAKIDDKLLKPTEIVTALDDLCTAIEAELTDDPLRQSRVGELFDATRARLQLPKRGRNVRREVKQAQEFLAKRPKSAEWGFEVPLPEL